MSKGNFTCRVRDNKSNILAQPNAFGVDVERILSDFGSMRFFCKKHEIKYMPFYRLLQKRVAKIYVNSELNEILKKLEKLGFIKNAKKA